MIGTRRREILSVLCFNAIFQKVWVWKKWPLYIQKTRRTSGSINCKKVTEPITMHKDLKVTPKGIAGRESKLLSADETKHLVKNNKTIF